MAVVTGMFPSKILNPNLHSLNASPSFSEKAFSSLISASSHPLPQTPLQHEVFFFFLQGGPGSVRFGYGLGMERFERFRFSVPAVPLRREFLCVSVQFSREDGSGSGFGKTVLAVPALRSVPGKTVGSDVVKYTGRCQ